MNARKQNFAHAIDHIQKAKKIANENCEFPEFNVLLLEIDEALEDLKIRLKAMANTGNQKAQVALNSLCMAAGSSS